MSVASILYFLFLMLGIPLIILVVGFVLFFVRSKHRRKIGAVLIVIGGVELSIWLILSGGIPHIGSGEIISIVTIILGLVSLYSASRNSKN